MTPFQFVFAYALISRFPIFWVRHILVKHLPMLWITQDDMNDAMVAATKAMECLSVMLAEMAEMEQTEFDAITKNYEAERPTGD